MKILFICTTAKDRSPALVRYFNANYPAHEYKCAGVNRYHCDLNATHYLTQEDLKWADLVVFAEDIHRVVYNRDFPLHIAQAFPNAGDVFQNFNNDESFSKKRWLVLNAGQYEKGRDDDFMLIADLKVSKFFPAPKL